MNKKSEIAKRVSTYDSTANHVKTKQLLQDRLKKLVKDHGEEFVAMATGYTINTLKQYLRVTIPPSISEQSIIKAEKILEGL